MNYEVKKNLVGKLMVYYDCPNCREPLSSGLSEAGQKENCPSCQGVFLVPGANELQQVKQRREERKQASQSSIREPELAAPKPSKWTEALPPEPPASAALVRSPEPSMKVIRRVDDRYLFLKILSLLIQVAGWILLAIAFASLVNDVIAIADALKDPNSSSVLSAIVAARLAGTASILLMSVFVLGFSQLLNCIRDMAINSFKLLVRQNDFRIDGDRA